MNWRRLIPAPDGDRGQVLLLTAFSLTVLVGMAALSIDASFMYDKRNKLYSAADAGAKSGAIELWKNASVAQAGLEAFADQQAAWHGFQSTRYGGTTSIVVHHPPTSGAFAGNASYVEVIASEPTSTFFGTIFSRFNMTPGARAVAGTSPGSNCLITLEDDIVLGVAHLDMPGCGIADAGDLTIANGNAGIDASSVAVTGTCSGSNCPANVQTGAPPPSDPLAGLPAPTNPGSCTSVSVGSNATLSLPRGCYSGITMNNNSILLFDDGPGEYYVTGPIVTGNSPTICLNAGCTFDYSHGIMLYLTQNAYIDLPNGTTMRLNAQTSGPYTGILMFQDPANTNASTFNNGSATYDLSGALYFPTAHLDFGNGGSTNDCSLIVAASLTMGNGQNTLSNTCSQYGGSPILTVTLAE